MARWPGTNTASLLILPVTLTVLLVNPRAGLLIVTGLSLAAGVLVRMGRGPAADGSRGLGWPGASRC